MTELRDVLRNLRAGITDSDAILAGILTAAFEAHERQLPQQDLCENVLNFVGGIKVIGGKQQPVPV